MINIILLTKVNKLKTPMNFNSKKKCNSTKFFKKIDLFNDLTMRKT